jgi:hypothetical protein
MFKAVLVFIYFVLFVKYILYILWNVKRMHKQEVECRVTKLHSEHRMSHSGDEHILPNAENKKN